MDAIADAHLSFLNFDASVRAFLNLEPLLNHVCGEQVPDLFIVDLDELASDEDLLDAFGLSFCRCVDNVEDVVKHIWHYSFLML